jgi:hypothetical protein
MREARPGKGGLSRSVSPFTRLGFAAWSCGGLLVHARKARFGFEGTDTRGFSPGPGRVVVDVTCSAAR